MPNLFAIAVTGSMNPAIHSPMFYRLKELATEEEVRSSLEAADVLVSAQAAQFSIGSLRIVCLADRWQVSTVEFGDLNRALDLTVRVFGILEHTPVTAFSFQFDLLKRLGITNVAQALARAVCDADVGFSIGLPRALGSLIFVQDGEEEHLKLRATYQLDTIRNGPPDELLLRSIFTYDIALDRFDHFDLGEMMRPRLPHDVQAAQALLARCAAALEKREVMHA